MLGVWGIVGTVLVNKKPALSMGAGAEIRI